MSAQRWATVGGVNGRPDWIMLGTPAARGGVFVFASKELSSAELTAVITNPDREFGDMTRVYQSPTTYQLGAELRSVVCVAGRDYPDAIRNLFRFWQPDADPPTRVGQPALGEPLPAIEAEIVDE